VIFEWILTEQRTGFWLQSCHQRSKAEQKHKIDTVTVIREGEELSFLFPASTYYSYIISIMLAFKQSAHQTQYMRDAQWAKTKVEQTTSLTAVDGSHIVIVRAVQWHCAKRAETHFRAEAPEIFP